MSVFDDEPAPALGTVVEQGRGSLPYELIHGEALVACAAWALGAAGVVSVDLGTAWSEVVAAQATYVIHDSLCPMTPADFIERCVRIATDEDCVVVGVVGGVDPSGSGSEVGSPVVLPPAAVAAYDDVPPLDFVALVASLEQRFEVRRLDAPPHGRRVGSSDEVRSLERASTPEPALPEPR